MLLSRSLLDKHAMAEPVRDVRPITGRPRSFRQNNSRHQRKRAKSHVENPYQNIDNFRHNGRVVQRLPRYVAAGASGFGSVREVYRGRFPRYWYVAVAFFLFGTFLGCAGSPWWIWTVVWVPSLLGVAGGLATKANTALYLFDHGLVTTSLLRRVKATAGWSVVKSIDQQVYPMPHGGPRLVCFVHLVDGRVVEVDTDVLHDGPDAVLQMSAALRRARQQS